MTVVCNCVLPNKPCATCKEQIERERRESGGNWVGFPAVTVPDVMPFPYIPPTAPQRSAPEPLEELIRRVVRDEIAKAKEGK
jgi:hypothetical protein